MTFRKPALAPAPTVQDWAAQADAPDTGHDRPWLAADPKRTQQFPMRMPAPLHAKLTWLKANLPGGPSIQQQVLNSVEAYADQMIAQLEEERALRRDRQP